MKIKTRIVSAGIAMSLCVSAFASTPAQVYTVKNTSTPATDFTEAAEKTVNGVVSIKSYSTPRQSGFYGSDMMDPFEFFFGPQPRQQQPRQQQQTGLGSGVILSPDGFIVTNNHVIDGAEKLEVTLNDNRTFNATVWGADPTTDLALIKIEADNLNAIPLGDSENLKVGEWVLAVGNPFGFTSTVTTGIVSAKARNISALTHSASRNNAIEAYIQTDAAVNPGNSGGALVNLNGELVGINTAIYSQTGNFAGYSFAIPVSIVKKIVADLREYRTVQRAFLGVSFRELTPELAKEKEINKPQSGLYVAKVEDRSAALEAGLKEGDVIVSINGAPTTTTGQLQEEMAKLTPGETVKIEYYRNDKKYTTNATLKNIQGTTSLSRPSSMNDLGCAFKSLSKNDLKEFGLTNGVQVEDLKEGAFMEAGVKNGFIVTMINNKKITKVTDIEEIYNSVMRDGSSEKVLIVKGVYPTGQTRTYAVNLVDE